MPTEIGLGDELGIKCDPDGRAHVSDLNITAALLSLSGAAWDGKSQPVYKPAADSPDYAAWRAVLDRPEMRQMDVQLVGHQQGIVEQQVISKDGWTDKATDIHYALGELAPFRRVVYELEARYCWLTAGQVTRRVAFTPADWQFWFRQWFKPGGLLNGARTQVEQRNRLLDLNRENYGIGTTLHAAGKVHHGHDAD